VLVVKDGMIIARIDIIREGEEAAERPTEASESCIYYECREA
jgi:hypothetical protein